MNSISNAIVSTAIQANSKHGRIPANLSLMDVKKSKSPEEFSTYLQSHGDIFYWPAAEFYVVTSMELAKEVLKRPAFSADRSSFFISRMPELDLRLIKDFFGVVQKMMVMSDDKEHSTRRKAAALGIDGELLDHYKPIIEKTVGKLIERAAAKGEIEFVRDIAEPLPSIVLADLFCIPEQDREQFYQWSIQMTQFFGGATTYFDEDGKRVNKAAKALREYFQALLEERRKNSGPDFVSVLLENQKNFGLSDDEVISQAIMMLVAGQVTTTDQLNNNMFTMLDSGSVPTLAENLEKVPAAMEEFNRLDPGVTFLFRTVRKEIELGGVRLKPGDVIFVSNHAVNRDASIFESPNSVQLDRKVNPHFAYGHGPHFCLGARLARMQMQMCFTELLRRYPKLRLNKSKPAKRLHYALSFSGFESIHIEI